jgi:hypothetical protein
MDRIKIVEEINQLPQEVPKAFADAVIDIANA